MIIRFRSGCRDVSLLKYYPPETRISEIKLSRRKE